VIDDLQREEQTRAFDLCILQCFTCSDFRFGNRSRCHLARPKLNFCKSRLGSSLVVVAQCCILGSRTNSYQLYVYAGLLDVKCIISCFECDW